MLIDIAATRLSLPAGRTRRLSSDRARSATVRLLLIAIQLP